MTSLKFAPFSSEMELPFYSALFSSKLDHDKLDDSARPVLGLYEPRPNEAPEQSTRLQILGTALTSNRVPLGVSRAEGFIKNVNTIEEFKNADKSAMIKNAARQIWDAIQDGTIYSVPSLLASFAILSFADLKKYRFTYWFAFPALHSDPQWMRTGPVTGLDPQESTTLVERVGTWRYRLDTREHGFFLVKKIRDKEAELSFPLDEAGIDLGYSWEVGSLRDFENGFFKTTPEADQFVAFVDPSNYPDNPAWPLRNLLVLVRQRYRLSKVQILCYRDTQAKRDEARSIILPLALHGPGNTELATMPSVTGWERNQHGELKCRVANLGEYMDPARLADQAVDLNLKLMKWRIAPHLNLDVIKAQKCLLLGAGTLGSYVSRNLMGWGVRKISFVDYGFVSFSNPVRQPLFNFDDCLYGGKPKALQAAEALKQIYPGVDAHGHVISVPMLGHPVTDEKKTMADYIKLRQLMETHDVVFLLMDSRESRWLPAVMAKASHKIVINAALGFDSYLVMRHGADSEQREKALGCYFCNDVVVAGDSMKDQTLDQQCTVTRPGVAAMAAALAVELLVSLLQHPERNLAPAPMSRARRSGDGPIEIERDPPHHPLGIVPHQIRGFLSSFQNMVLTGTAYPHCSACSPPVLAAYNGNDWDFVKRALAERDYVAEVSGLADVQRRAEAAAADVELEEDDMGAGEGGGGGGEGGLMV